MKTPTPGPWRYSRNKGCRTISGDKRGHQRQSTYREIAGTFGLADDDEDEANARQMAASPELFEALERLERIADLVARRLEGPMSIEGIATQGALADATARARIALKSARSAKLVKPIDPPIKTAGTDQNPVECDNCDGTGLVPQICNGCGQVLTRDTVAAPFGEEGDDVCSACEKEDDDFAAEQERKRVRP